MNTATPHDRELIALLGGETFEGIAFTPDQLRALRRFYGFSDAVSRQSLEDVREAHERAQTKQMADLAKLPSYRRHAGSGPVEFDEPAIKRWIKTGENTNLFRRTRDDGLRLMAFLAKHLEPGEDPVKVIIELFIDAGYDVKAEDVAWVRDEDIDMEE
jgi:hypothetical protein